MAAGMNFIFASKTREIYDDAFHTSNTVEASDVNYWIYQWRVFSKISHRIVRVIWQLRTRTLKYVC